MADLGEVWSTGLSRFCSSLGGSFSALEGTPWIKVCDLPGRHVVRFWNDGDADPPKRIGVTVFPAGVDSKVPLGDFEKFEGRCVIASESRDTHSSYFSKNTVRGSFCLTDDPDYPFRVYSGVHSERRDVQFRPGLSADDKRAVDEWRSLCADAWDKERVLYEKLKSVTGAEHEKLFPEWKAAHDRLGEVCDKIEDVRAVYGEPVYSFQDEKVGSLVRQQDAHDPWSDLQVRYTGSTSGYIHDVEFFLPRGLPPRERKVPESVTVVPAPYSYLWQIPSEEGWVSEIKHGPDRIEFYAEGWGPHVVTLRDLSKMGVKTVGVRMPDGEVRSFSLADVLG